MTRPLFLGTEPSQAPAVLDLLRAARGLSDGGISGGALSSRFGARFVVNAAGIPLEMLGGKHFVEVADYDPHQDHVLCLGEHAPSPYAPLHALLYRAKKEVGAVAQVELPQGHEALARLPKVARGRTTLEGALAVLEALRTVDAVAFADRTVLAVGRDVAEARAALERALGGA